MYTILLYSVVAAVAVHLEESGAASIHDMCKHLSMCKDLSKKYWLGRDASSTEDEFRTNTHMMPRRAN
jgi:hypothetical protein